jgi:hypothetical protein
LHISYNSCTFVDAGANQASIITLGGGATALNVISINDTVVVLDPAGLESKGIVTAVTGTGAAAGTITVQPFGNSALVDDGFAATGLKVFVYGSAYSKGTSIGAGGGNSASRVSVEPVLTQYANSPIIIRDQYVVSGSDMSQIGWVEVATEDGTSGYLWYLKAESETRLRFEDYLEMSVM